LCLNSLPEEEGIALAKKLTKHSSVSFGNELTYAGYKDVPVSWFFCEDDKCITPEVQQVRPMYFQIHINDRVLTWMQTAIDDIEASWKGTEREGTKVEVTSVKCDHIPVFSARDELEKWMETLFEKSKTPCEKICASTC
jgi:hypothetical protein